MRHKVSWSKEYQIPSQVFSRILERMRECPSVWNENKFLNAMKASGYSKKSNFKGMMDEIQILVKNYFTDTYGTRTVKIIGTITEMCINPVEDFIVLKVDRTITTSTRLGADAVYLIYHLPTREIKDLPKEVKEKYFGE